MDGRHSHRRLPHDALESFSWLIPCASGAFSHLGAQTCARRYTGSKPCCAQISRNCADCAATCVRCVLANCGKIMSDMTLRDAFAAQALAGLIAAKIDSRLEFI